MKTRDVISAASEVFAPGGAHVTATRMRDSAASFTVTIPLASAGYAGLRTGDVTERQIATSHAEQALARRLGGPVRIGDVTFGRTRCRLIVHA